MIALTAQSIGSFLDIALEIGIGAYLCLVGWNKVKISKNEASDAEWKTKYGKLYRICGPLLVVIAIAQLFLRSFK
jgi:hypothetical protein